MIRKEIVKLIRDKLGRDPTIVEINYCILTGHIKRRYKFTLEERNRHDPKSYHLKEAYVFIKALLYVHEHKSIILGRIREDGIKSKALEAKEAKKFQQFLNQHQKGMRRHRLAESVEVVDQLRDNKRRIASVVDYHIRHQTAPTEEMMYLINKYQ